MKARICYLPFAICLFATAMPSYAAMTIKKAESVAPAAKSAGDALTGNSLVPTALSLITGVMALNQQMKDLTGDCIPTDTEINWVSGIMKEYAKTGAANQKSITAGLKSEPCEGESFKDRMQSAAMTSGIQPCFVKFNTDSDNGMIWQDYPKASKASICKKNGGFNCLPKDEQIVSDVYDVFALVGFGPADYLPGEATLAAKMTEKIERCSNVKLAAKKRELWGEFLINSAGGLGKTGAGLADTMNTVNQIMSGGGAASHLNAVMGMAPSLAGGLMK
ncbi:MAG: hypothetical protein LBK26_00695 [Rickettsiales bacterium]|nr:hypothetical protein [Rickettsiales bacterium]